MAESSSSETTMLYFYDKKSLLLQAEQPYLRLSSLQLISKHGSKQGNKEQIKHKSTILS